LLPFILLEKVFFAAEYVYSKNKIGHKRKSNPFEMNLYVPELSCGNQPEEIIILLPKKSVIIHFGVAYC